MEIQYLTYLRDSPIGNWPIKPISLSEIEQLETLYNNGDSFPKALKELLFLAGKYCYVLDYGVFDDLQEMQDFVRSEMAEENKTITRPFFAIDVYNLGDQFIFVYLDEGDDPPTYELHYYSDDNDWIWEVTPTLSELINQGIDKVKQSINPF
ncbi:SMI1/KNR4 family protein [Pedobacter sp.]|uniref:SMI1/KNR4 family protein n=1 Tax=Pedobacter sp. TaxID=1411316 RepID=UPI0031D66EF1